MTAYMDHKDLTNQTISPERAAQIAEGVERVRESIARAEETAGRPAGSVALLAATKTRDVGEIMAAIDAGITLIGENRPQEVTAKTAGLRAECAARSITLGCVQSMTETVRETATAEAPGALAAAGSPAPGGTADGHAAQEGGNVTPRTGSKGKVVGFHLIGQLQGNKIGKVLGVVDVIESVDSLRLAERISTRAVERGLTVGVLVEVNESGEASKSGCAPGAALDLARAVAALPGIRLDGLMTVGAHVDDERTVRSGFAHLRALRDTLVAEIPTCTELSMGMTSDLEYAVAEGSTLVRVGTAIFGPRAFI